MSINNPVPAVGERLDQRGPAGAWDNVGDLAPTFDAFMARLWRDDEDEN